MLLLLAHFGKEGVPETVILKLSQGNSRGDDRDNSVASQLLHEQVQKLSFVNCGESGLQAHSSLLNVLLHD